MVDRPKGVRLTQRNMWMDAVGMALHTSLSVRDVYLRTLPTFHVNGWGVLFAAAGLGIPQIVLRKVDGGEILRRRGPRRHHMCAAPIRTVARVQEELGWEFIQIDGLTETSPLLSGNRTRAEWNDLGPLDRAAQLPGRRARARHACADL